VDSLEAETQLGGMLTLISVQWGRVRMGENGAFRGGSRPARWRET